MQRSRQTVKWPSWVPGCSLLGVLVSLALGGPWGAANALGSAPLSTPGGITLRDGRLTAHLHGVPLRQVMADVSRRGAVQVRWLDAGVGEQEVSAAFTDLPLPEALKRMLRGTNFMFFYTSPREGLRLTQIWIASRGEGGGPPALTEGPAEGTAQPFEGAIQTTLGAEELASRLNALEQLGRRAEEDARVSGILSPLGHSDTQLPGREEDLPGEAPTSE